MIRALIKKCFWRLARERVNRLRLKSMVDYHTPNYSVASRFHNYWIKCRSESEDVGCGGLVDASVEEYREHGITSWQNEESHLLAKVMVERIESAGAVEDIWDSETGRFNYELWKFFPQLKKLFSGRLGDFLRGIYGCPFKIWSGALYRSEWKARQPNGSQLWHWDGGPGTCINIMFGLSDIYPQNGALQGISRKDMPTITRHYGDIETALEAKWREEFANTEFRRNGDQVRSSRSKLLDAIISDGEFGPIRKPTGKAGLIIPFSNNILHRGGYPEKGETRMAMVFHIYPASIECGLSRYSEQGISKKGPYPDSPEEIF